MLAATSRAQVTNELERSVDDDPAREVLEHLAHTTGPPVIRHRSERVPARALHVELAREEQRDPDPADRLAAGNGPDRRVGEPRAAERVAVARHAIDRAGLLLTDDAERDVL